MKKVLLVIVVTVLGLGKTNAQEVQFGVKGGLNFASINGDNSGKFDHVTSFNFGVMAEIPISTKFSFQPELLYSRQGFSVGKNVNELNYLNIPLMGKYYLTEGLSLEAGPQIGFLLSAKNKSIDVKDSFNKLDFGINLGIGYKLDNGLSFNARYNQGLSNVNDVSGLTDKNRNGVFQVSVGYFFF